MPIELNFDGIIGEAPNDAASVRAALRAGGPVQVNINSYGGVATEGLAIYNLLKAHAARVDVTVDAVAASAASLIAMAGDSIAMRAGSLLMIHDPSAVAIGPAAVMEQTRDVLEKMANQYASIYAARSGKTVEQVRALMIAETWLSGPEAVENGFAEAASSEGVAASAPAFDNDNFRFRNMPASIAALATKVPPMTTPNPAPTPAKPDAAANFTDILARCTKANLSLATANEIVAKSGGDVEKAKDLILDAVIASAPGRAEPFVPGDSLDNPSTLHTAVRDVLLARMTGKPVKPGTPAEALVGKPLLDLGAMVVQANGGKIRSWHRDQLAEQIFAPTMRGQHSTSDFPGLTLDAGNRVLLDAYAAAASPLKTVARRRSAQDFRSIAALRLGEAPALLEVGEGAEVTYGTRAEAKESFKLRTFARIFSITRQALVNDDLQAFADMARAWGIAAANVEADQLYTLIADDGVVMEDSKSLWHADHSNVAGSAAALDVDALSDARKALRDSKGLDGVTPLNLVPKFLLVGSANETEAEKVLASLAAATVSEQNPFGGSGKLTLLVEPRISDYAFYVFADPQQAEVLAYANLGDAIGPQLATKEGWTGLGQEFRAVNDFGAGATGFRGAYKNAGAAPT